MMRLNFWTVVGILIAAILGLLALGFAAMSTNPLFTVPPWVPVIFFIAAGLTALALVIYLLWPKMKQWYVFSGGVITEAVLQNNTRKSASVISKPKQRDISEVVFDILRKMKYRIDELQKLITIPNLQEADRVVIENLYQRYGDTPEDRATFFVRLTNAMYKLTQPNLEKLLEDNDDWKNLNRKLDIVKNRIGDKEFTGKCLAYIEFTAGMAMDTVYFRHNNERQSNISSAYYLGMLEDRIHKLLQKYKKVIVDDIDSLIVNLEDTKPQLIVESKAWSSNRGISGGTWWLKIFNQGLDDVQGVGILEQVELANPGKDQSMASYSQSCHVLW